MMRPHDREAAHELLSRLEPEARFIAARAVRLVSLPAGTILFGPGDAARDYLLLARGRVRVSVTTEQGRDIILYRVGPGEACVLTTAGLLSGADYGADAYAETDVEALLLPKPAFEDMLARSAQFRHLVFSSYGERLLTLIALVQEIAGRRLDRSLCRFLLDNAVEGRVRLTHQRIADELNTAREVVSRLLLDFAGRGWVEVERGQVILQDAEALRGYAG